MSVYDHNGTNSSEIKKLYDYNGTTNSEIKKAYDHDNTVAHEIFTGAETFTVAGVNTSVYRTTGLQGSNTINTASFTLDGHSTISFQLSARLSGAYRNDYLPGHTVVAILYKSGGTEMTRTTLDAFGDGWPYSPLSGTTAVSWNVTNYTGTYYIQIYTYVHVQNIYNPDGSEQTATVEGCIGTVDVNNLRNLVVGNATVTAA